MIQPWLRLKDDDPRKTAAYLQWLIRIKHQPLPPLSKPPCEVTPIFYDPPYGFIPVIYRRPSSEPSTPAARSPHPAD